MWRTKEKASILLEPYSSKHFLYFRAIQGHSGGKLGNAHEIALHHPGRIDSRRKKSQEGQAVSLLPQDLEGVEYDLDEHRIAPYKHTWTSHQNTVFWCNLKLPQRKGLQLYQTRSHAITFSSTLPAIRIEKSGMHEDWRGSILQDISITKVTACYTCAESQDSRKDPPNPDAKESNDNESEKRLHRGTCRGNIDFHSGPNLFERFRGFLKLISRFEFDFLRRENYFF